MDDTPRENPPPGNTPGRGTTRLAFGLMTRGTSRRGRLIAVILGVVVLVAAGCGYAPGDAGQPEATQTLSRTFAVSGRDTLVIRDSAGNVTVTRGGDGQVGVQITKRVRSLPGAEAQRVLESVAVDLTQDGNSVTIQTHFPGDSGSTSGASPTVDVQVTAPQASQLDINAAAGNVTIREIAGQMTVTATAGNIEAQNAIFAGFSRLSASAGNVTLDGEMNSASVLQADVKAGNISLRLPAPISAHLDARTDVGTITVSGWQVSVTQVGTTGAQAVADFQPGPTDQITLRVGTGNITVAQR